MTTNSTTETRTDAVSASTRRRFVAGLGAAGLATTLPFAGSAAADETIVDETLDTASDALQETLVVFEETDQVDRLAELDLALGYHSFAVLPVGYTELTGEQLLEISAWDDVRYVSANRDLEYFNDDSRETTGADRVQDGEDLETAYTGKNVHTAVIDTGVDGAHPDLEGNLAANWQWVGDPLEQDVLWEDLGP
ncbi:hypothetical protein [Natronococcus sp. A-GB7]|uniref:hypothetical protein n=1 Tax=Natronococcus sp. A-GB7 TaxID=3037649 RepID=UPI00241D7A64|nr:hypothetical protein [Natronococcus sp. A-GB7]MDG5821034.1 hypothetical protein [Natronococcus sp. A-GB7]